MAEHADEVIARQIGSAGKLAERDGFAQVAVDEAQGIADALVRRFVAWMGQAHEPRQQLVDDAQRLHALVQGALAVKPNAFNQRVAVVVDSGVGGAQAHGFIVLAYGAEQMEVMVGAFYFHGKFKVGEHSGAVGILVNVDVVVVETARTYVGVLHERGHDVHASGCEGVCAGGEAERCGARSHVVQTGERAADILEVPVGVVGGMPYVECEQLRESGESVHNADIAVGPVMWKVVQILYAQVSAFM